MRIFSKQAFAGKEGGIAGFAAMVAFPSYSSYFSSQSIALGGCGA